MRVMISVRRTIGRAQLPVDLPARPQPCRASDQSSWPPARWRPSDPRAPEALPTRGGAKKSPRRAYRAISDIPLGIPKDELDRRLSVFGSTHFGICPTINLPGLEFRAVLPPA